jgi:hypothetical protein
MTGRMRTSRRARQESVALNPGVVGVDALPAMAQDRPATE